MQYSAPFKKQLSSLEKKEAFPTRLLVREWQLFPAKSCRLPSGWPLLTTTGLLIHT